MKFERIVIIVGFAFAGAVPTANADPAKFWLSTSYASPIIPDAPSINAAVGRQQTLYIWAQPAADGNGFRTLQDFSIDIVTQTPNLGAEPQPIIDFVNGTFKVYNDIVISGKPRFQYTTDSLRPADQGGPLESEKTAAQVASGEPDAVKGLQGLSLVNDNVVGIGNINDPNRVTIGGVSAWRVAALDFKPLQTGTNTLFLQVGYSGMVHQGAGGNPVVFGNNASPIYDAANINHRQTNLSGDTFDLLVNAVAFTPGDYNSDGVVGPADFALWRSTFGQIVVSGEGADGNGNGVVDAADYVFWRKRMVSGSGTSDLATSNLTSTVPEPGTITLISILLACTPSLRPIRQRHYSSEPHPIWEPNEMLGIRVFRPRRMAT